MTTSLPQPGVARPVISEMEWKLILQRIEDHKVIPVIGEHLSLIKRDSRGPEIPLAEYLAGKLELEGAPPKTLSDLALRYLERNRRGLDDFYSLIFQSLCEADVLSVPEPLRQLAEIRDFDLFVTTSFDPFMALALNEVRFGRRSSGSTRVMAYECNRSVDIPEQFRTLDYPLVYHLFGKAQAAPIFAVTDEDVLEFVHTLQSPECQPPNLFTALREQRLLLLGTRLTGWLTRFFLRTSASDRLSHAKRSDYVIDPGVVAGDDQALFFENFGEVKLLPMTGPRFVEELNRRWKARLPQGTAAAGAATGAAAASGQGEVFLSYASEDLAVVKTLRERIEREAGVRVWLDKKALRGGEQWGRHIADALRSCTVCVPVISTHAKSSGFRFVRTEWDEALRLKKGQAANRTFVIPLAIDDTSKSDESIAPEIRALHWRNMNDEQDMALFISELRAEIEKAAP